MNPVFSSEPSLVVCTCSAGVAPILADEISSLGMRVDKVFDTAVETEGTLEDCVRLNLRLRTAHRVLYALDRFRARNANDLYDELVAVPWERYLDPNGYFSVDRSVSNPTIRNSQFASLKVKDAIADRMRNACGRRPDSGNERTDACVFLHWFGDQATIYIDTTGQALSFRGYREITSEAPIRESLAAALILASGWRGEGSFLSPMCGSGTFAIEALWIAQRRPPAMSRQNFSFMHLACFDPKIWTDILAEARKEYYASRDVKCEIIATDIDEAMTAATRRNAEVACAADRIRIETCDVRHSPHPRTEARGVAVVNPPYGGRIGDPVRLRDTYEDIGGFLAAAKEDGYDGYVFTGNPELADSAGLVSARTRSFFSGELECLLLENPELTPEAKRRFERRQR